MAKLKRLFERGEHEIPAPVRKKTAKAALAGLLITGASVAAVIVGMSLLCIPFAALFGGAIFFMQYLKELRLTREGIRTLEGTCIEVEMTMLPKRGTSRQPKRFLVKGYNEILNDTVIYSVPYLKGDAILEKGQRVLIYTENRDSFFSNPFSGSGYVSLPNILGYEGLFTETTREEESREEPEKTGEEKRREKGRIVSLPLGKKAAETGESSEKDDV